MGLKMSLHNDHNNFLSIGLCLLLGAFMIVALTSTVNAQEEPILLDEGCSVTVGNQTAVVRSDGTFFVQNISVIPIGTIGIASQLYRVRATCIRDGEAITGQSGFFSLISAETTFITDVFPTALDPIPVSISVTAPADFLLLGETVQLTATAVLPDGSTEDVTLRSAGTAYSSSNPNLLTVDENGLITGQNSTSSVQAVTISALNEGNITTIFITAEGPSDDLDNDGMPNDYEDLFGLDPLVNDANGDLDNDGLTNIEEFNLGALPNNPDTDGDGAVDGRDANPLIPDTESPTVIITAPDNGDSFARGENVVVTASAQDNDGVDFVEFKLNDITVFTDTTSPYEYQFLMLDRVSELSLGATAFDFAGLSGSSTPVVISALADPDDSDGDGISDATEILLGSDPNDASSVPPVIGPAFSNDTLSVYLPVSATEALAGQAFVETRLSVYLPISNNQPVSEQAFGWESLSVYLPVLATEALTGQAFVETRLSVYLPISNNQPVSEQAFEWESLSVYLPVLATEALSGQAFGIDRLSIILPAMVDQPLNGPSFGYDYISVLLEE